MADTQEQIRQQRNRLAEQGTDYAKKLSNVDKDFLELYKYNINSYDLDQAWSNYGNLSRGTTIFDNQDDLVLYMLFYAGMHYYKWEFLFEQFFLSQQQNLNNRIIEVIDYGCGQALASCCLLDYLNKKKNTSLNIAGFTLLEPSELASKRGVLHINHFINGRNPYVYIANKLLDDVSEQDLATNEKTVKLHLFSNIIDVEGIDLNALANKIIKTQKGLNYFLCVSPDNGTASSRVNNFANCFSSKTELPSSNEIIRRPIYYVRAGEFRQSEITRQNKVFFVNF